MFVLDVVSSGLIKTKCEQRTGIKAEQRGPDEKEAYTMVWRLKTSDKVITLSCGDACKHLIRVSSTSRLRTLARTAVLQLGMCR